MTAAVAMIFGVTFAASVAVLVLDPRDDDGLRRDGRHRHELTSALAAVHDLGAGLEAELFLELPGRAAVGMIRRGRGEARQLAVDRRHERRPAHALLRLRPYEVDEGRLLPRLRLRLCLYDERLRRIADDLHEL